MGQEDQIFKAWDNQTLTMSPSPMSMKAWIVLMATTVEKEQLGNTLSNIWFLEYIGKEDLNNVPIFISDIVEATFPTEFGSFTKEMGVICFCAGCSRFVVRKMTRLSANQIQIDQDRHWELGHNVKLTIIGNLLSTPELVK